MICKHIKGWVRKSAYPIWYIQAIVVVLVGAALKRDEKE